MALVLPPDAPELNSAETVWEYLRSNWLSHKVWDTYDAIPMPAATHGTR
jgi:hypothetical protein